MKKVSIGDLRNRVVFKNKARTSDGAGGFTSTWSTVATVWAKVVPISGTERLKAEQLYTPISHKIYVRYSRTVTYTPSMKIEFDGREFAIRTITKIDEGRTEFLEIVAIEGDPS